MIGEKTPQIGARGQLAVDLDHLAYDVRRDLLRVGFHHESLGILEGVEHRCRVDPAPPRADMDGTQYIEVGASTTLDVPEKGPDISCVQAGE